MNILFVCSGNICRSPLAEALLRYKVSSLTLSSGSTASEPNIRVKSAGTAASARQPMSLLMETILQEKGIDSTHQSQRLNWDLLDWADLILTMTRAQKLLLTSQIPQLTPKLATLNEYADQSAFPDIEDPYGSDLNSYRQCAAEIEAACDRLLSKLQTLV
ncbi:MAG: low molecular weight protein arginine phosphatase [Leptolyngbyaceae cyanobacterium SM1_1_3]|nr:low molecular weight protein arginine phosphatase [Leptolyngbyaceae cyanobacterium SM1_1_3]NJN04607.1 low molecular weight protein arginine phosphatase [Leptolyngbyaceae cyanobacterium RM1_1_2]NJO11543.1 low molecular weight protein arginine phosphatase [Leptolyngbyaceae cyanobacterium SL_1_1]